MYLFESDLCPLYGRIFPKWVSSSLEDANYYIHGLIYVWFQHYSGMNILACNIVKMLEN